MVRRRGCNAQVRSARTEVCHRVVFHNDPHGHGCHSGPSLVSPAPAPSPGILALRGVAVALCSEERGE